MTELFTASLAVAFGGMVMLYLTLACVYMILVLAKEANELSARQFDDGDEDRKDYREVTPAAQVSA